MADVRDAAIAAAVSMPSAVAPSFHYHRAPRSPAVEAIICEPEIPLASSSADGDSFGEISEGRAGRVLNHVKKEKDGFSDQAFPVSILSMSRPASLHRESACNTSNSSSSSRSSTDGGNVSEEEDTSRYDRIVNYCTVLLQYLGVHIIVLLYFTT